MSKIIKICRHCKKEFLVYESYIKRGIGIYCSKSCATTFRNLNNNPSKSEEARLKISLNHADVSGDKNPMYNKKGKLCPSYIDGRSYYKGESYRGIAFANYEHKCSICGKSDKLAVHHKDKNRKNNDIKNLEIVCYNCHNNILHKPSRDEKGRIKKEMII